MNADKFQPTTRFSTSEPIDHNCRNRCFATQLHVRPSRRRLFWQAWSWFSLVTINKMQSTNISTQQSVICAESYWQSGLFSSSRWFHPPSQGALSVWSKVLDSFWALNQHTVDQNKSKWRKVLVFLINMYISYVGWGCHLETLILIPPDNRLSQAE